MYMNMVDGLASFNANIDTNIECVWMESINDDIPYLVEQCQAIGLLL